MKKKLLLLLALPLLLLTACNYQMVDTKFNFSKVHINGRGCFEISSWRDYENSDQIQVKIKNYGTCLFHASEIILVESKCPVCGN